MLVQVVLSLLACWSGAHAMYILEEAPQLFEDFIHKYEKTYATEAEKQHRFNVFVQNLEDANRRNEELQKEAYGIDKFSDLTSEEFTSKHSCYQPPTFNGSTKFNSSMFYGAPDSFDWRTKNAVTTPRQQGNCNCCYAFSVIENIEGIYAVKHGQLYNLAPQQIVDCSTLTNGCTSSDPTNAYRYIIQTGGIESESDYPYAAVQHPQCYFNRNKVRVQITNFSSVRINSQEELKQYLYRTGPLSIGIDDTDLKGINPGHVLQNCQLRGRQNHAVLLVGYGTDPSGIPYWLVKNSWGTNWGEQGFFRMERGEGKPVCGMMGVPFMTAVVA